MSLLLQPSSATDLAAAIAESYPTLARYWPNLDRISLPQALFLLDDGRESVYGGAARGGKSDAILAAALQYVDVPKYAALILRRTFPELRGADGLLDRAHVWLANTDARWNEQERKWTFASGATLRFGHVETDVDRFNYDGQEYQYVGFDELTSFTELQYDHIGFTRMSRRPDLQVPLRTRGSCTPTGVGVGWVKRRFIRQRASDVLFVPAKVRDNPGVVPEEYEQGMERVPAELRRRLLEGDWDVFEGAAYPDFDVETHGVDAFDPPESFLRWEAMDHGQTAPTAWLLLCTDYDGNRIVLDEYYRPGELPDVHAAEILRRRKDWWQARDENGWPVTHPAYGDPASLREGLPVRDQFGQPKTLQDLYQDYGVHLVPANNRRKIGYLEVASVIKPDEERMFPAWHPRSGEKGAPRLFVVTSRCPHLVEQLQVAPLQPIDKTDGGEMVDPVWETSEGHCHACLRYGLTARPLTSKLPVAPPADARAARLADFRARRDRQGRADLVDV